MPARLTTCMVQAFSKIGRWINARPFGNVLLARRPFHSVSSLEPYDKTLGDFLVSGSRRKNSFGNRAEAVPHNGPAFLSAAPASSLKSTSCRLPGLQPAPTRARFISSDLETLDVKASEMTDSARNKVSTLILVGDEEYVLSASRGRVLFDNSSCTEASLEQITVSLDRHPDSSLTEDVAVPIILSAPSTPRFELSAAPFECLLKLRSPQTYTVTFIPPQVSESDYAWDNFQDQVVVHTRLSKLMIRLEAWKLKVPMSLSPEQESTLLFPVSLPDVKAPPLRRFGALERNADEKDPTQRYRAPSPCFPETPSVLDAKNSDVLPSLSRPPSSERQAAPSSYQPFTVSSPVVTTVQSLREAQEVILKLRRRRTHQNNSKVSLGTSPTSVADTELFPETVALDASTKADLEEFNSLVVAAKDQVTQETAKAKSELAYYQQLLPNPPSRDSVADLGSSTTALKPRKPRHLSAAIMRPSKLPSIVRPSSGAASSSAAVNNQEISALEQPQRWRVSARQRITRKTKLQSLSASQPKANNQLQTLDDGKLSDFDDPDPEVDDAPTLPDDLSGVSTLDADDYLPL